MKSHLMCLALIAVAWGLAPVASVGALWAEPPVSKEPSASASDGSSSADTAAESDSILDRLYPNGMGWKRTPQPLSHWVTQLGSDRYAARKLARTKLLAAGADAVPLLMKHFAGSNLEARKSTIELLGMLVQLDTPWSESSAMGALSDLADNQHGIVAQLAVSTRRAAVDARSGAALKSLVLDGAVVGYRESAIGSRTKTRLVLQVGAPFHGGEEGLRWLAWVRGIEVLDVQDLNLNAAMMKHIVGMPDCQTLKLIDCEISDDAFKQLDFMRPMSSLDLRYKKLNEEQFALLGRLPLRESLVLMGTGGGDAERETLERALPGVKVAVRNGGFLGVSCSSSSLDACTVNEVVLDSGADLAGVQKYDVIVRINDQKISRFDDLLEEIGKHHVGDEVKIKLLRSGVPVNCTATLQKLKN